MKDEDFEDYEPDAPVESDLEGDAIKFAERHGWWQAKFVSPGMRGVPDRVFIRRGRHIFVEFKKTKVPAKRRQLNVHQEMRNHGAEVYVVDNLAYAYALFR
jgi:hypothetical protein